ncbi:hypothetical protein M426DRAFT_28523 [Hypoxylon sp. CI-4A]|nr:hypothetical protein M426DRAFT_28523 [Hypoxylon sp. CI-4A]
MVGPIDSRESDPYLSHLLSTNRYESWMGLLRGRHMDLADKIHILDIKPTGDKDPWDAEIRTLALPAELEQKPFTDGTRLIIFDNTNRMYVQQNIGATYDIDPGFFRAVKMNSDQHEYYTGVEHRVPEFLAGGRPHHLDLGYGWASVIINHSNNLNIVLVSASFSPGATPDRDTSRKNIYLDFVRFSDRYLDAVLKYIHATYLYEGLINADNQFRLGRASRQERHDLVEKSWDALRMMKHDGMGPLNCIEHYDNLYSTTKVQNSGKYKDLANRLKCIREQISLTEALARDYLQHHVGMFGLEESRESIKQSKVGLEESRRTKLITVLAIFFVPISLGTSIFGMNIDELNQSGQSIWVFILTTALIVAATMTIWGFMYQLQKYSSLPKNSFLYECKPWQTRLLRFLQLILQGHVVWAWKSGIIVSLLVDGRVAFLRSCKEHLMQQPTVMDLTEMNQQRPPIHHTHSPCGYIMDHLRRKSAFDCSKLEGLPDRRSEF